MCKMGSCQLFRLGHLKKSYFDITRGYNLIYFSGLCLFVPLRPGEKPTYYPWEPPSDGYQQLKVQRMPVSNEEINISTLKLT